MRLALTSGRSLYLAARIAPCARYCQYSAVFHIFTINGDSAEDYFGSSVASAGDVNGDGALDIIAGAYEDDNNGAESGSAKVVVMDQCPGDPNKTAPGVCGCGIADTDSDSDGTPDCNDSCDNDPLKVSPGICDCGTSDTDTDLDSTPDCNESAADIDIVRIHRRLGESMPFRGPPWTASRGIVRQSQQFDAVTC